MPCASCAGLAAPPVGDFAHTVFGCRATQGRSGTTSKLVEGGIAVSVQFRLRQIQKLQPK